MSNNKSFYEDEHLNESAKSAVLNLIANTSKNAAKAVPGLTKVLTPGYGTFKGGAGTIGSAIKSVKADPNLATKGKKAKELVKRLGWTDRTPLGKAKSVIATGAAIGAGVDMATNQGQVTKDLAKNTGKTVASTVKILAKAPTSLLAGINIAATTASTLASTLSSIQSNFNDMYAKYNCFKEPNSEACRRLIAERDAAKQKAKEAANNSQPPTSTQPSKPTTIDKIKNLPSRVNDKLNQYSTAQKTAAGLGAAAVGLTAAAVAAKAIKDSFEKKDWYNKKCSGLSGEQRDKCHEYVYKRTMKELQSKLKRCKLANNQQKCVDIITAKIQELNQKTN